MSAQNELMPCPQCGETPILGYVCGEYFIMPLSKPVGVCFCGCFNEMHSNEDYEAEVWNKAVLKEQAEQALKEADTNA